MKREHFVDQFAADFAPQPFRDLARQTGWQQRTGKIDPFEFIVGLAFGQMSALQLSLSAQGQNLSVPVTAQAMNQRYHEKAVDFFKAAYEHCLGQSLAGPVGEDRTQKVREHFSAVVLFDSTSMDQPPALAKLFPGCGGVASSANLKVLLRYEYLRSQFEPLALLAGKRSDQGQAGRVAGALEAGQLGLFDKGFFALEALRQIILTEAYFLTPLPRSVQVWSGTEAQGVQKLDVAAALKASNETLVEWSQAWLGPDGSKGVPVRLVAFRLSPESANRRRAALRESLRRLGKTATAEALEWAGWLILITNAPAHKLPTPVLSYLYRVRWQIELVFRTVKWILRLDQTEGVKEARLRCEIWARLIVAVAVFCWHGQLQATAWQDGGWEISFEKVARHLQQHGLSLAQALCEGGLRLRQQLLKLWRGMLKGARRGRRKRKTTWQQLHEFWLEVASG